MIDFPTEVINPKICSDKTLTQIREMLRRVVFDGLGKQAGSPQFSVAGKTGTAQISQGTAGYKTGQTNYLVSFCGFFPSEAPKYSCIVAIQKPGLPASGGAMAGSVFGKIAERVYAKDLRLPMNHGVETETASLPDVKSGEVNQIIKVLDDLNIDNKLAFKHNKKKEDWSINTLMEDEIVLNKKDISADLIPSVVGMGAKDAVYLLESKGVKVRISGVGKVKRQSIVPGTKITGKQIINLTLN